MDLPDDRAELIRLLSRLDQEIAKSETNQADATDRLLRNAAASELRKLRRIHDGVIKKLGEKT